jgi:peptide/nickel transport system substrate-binding protein
MQGHRSLFAGTNARTICRRAAIASAVIAICVSSLFVHSRSAAAQEKALQIAAGYLPRSMDPAFDNSLFSVSVYSYAFDALTKTDARGEVLPSLATAWRIANPLRWEFTLADNIKFQDGSALTAADVVFSIERVTNSKFATAWQGTFPTVKSVSAEGGKTVVIETSEPTADLAQKLAIVFIVSKQAVEANPAEFAKRPIGTGPFMVTGWTPNDQLVLQASPHYWGKKPKIARVTIKNVPEEGTRIANLNAGTADIAYPIGPDHVAEISANRNLAVHTVIIAQNFVIAMRGVDSGPISDQRVRQALNHAVNAPAIFQALMHSQGALLKGQLGGPGVFGYDPNLTAYPYDPKKARELLAAAGHPNGFSTTMDIAVGRYPQDLQVAQAIVAQLGEVGVKVSLRTVTSSALVSSWLNGSISPLYVWGWNNPPTMSTAQPYIYYQSTQPQKILNSKEFDAAYREQTQELDVDKRRVALQKLGGMVRDLAPGIFLWQLPWTFGTSKRLQGFDANAQGAMDLVNLDLR